MDYEEKITLFLLLFMVYAFIIKQRLSKITLISKVFLIKTIS